ncbi:MAG: S16 family serine protease [Verrucomicrobiales bacterium]
MKFPSALLAPLLSLFLPSLLAADELPALRQAQIKGLLVVELANGEHAGVASQMNATVVPSHEQRFEIAFNQNVGELMEMATDEVLKFIHVRYPDKLPADKRIELAFSDKYSPKDGPSAAVVSALLCDSVLSGRKIDPGFAATGDMTATGEVRPVGGVPSKISGAVKKNCTIIGVPEANANSITDSYLLDGIKALYAIQIFTLKDFDQARDLSGLERSPELAQALTEFAAVQEVLARSEKYVFNAKVLEKLRNVVKLAPNHHSARLLYLHGTRQAPRILSLAGSIRGIDQASIELLQMINDGSYKNTSGNQDVLFKLSSRLNQLGPSLDKKTKPYARSLLALAEEIDKVREKSIITMQIRREFEAKANRVDTERASLLNDKAVREELMMD